MFVVFLFFIVWGICMKMGSWRVHLFLLLMPHLKAQSLLWFAISYCVNECQNWYYAFGWRGSSRSWWILKTTQVLCKDLCKITHTGGKMKLRSHKEWVEWSLKHCFKYFHPWPVSHEASVKLGTDCSCAGAGTKFNGTYREMSTAVLRLFLFD